MKYTNSNAKKSTKYDYNEIVSQISRLFFIWGSDFEVVVNIKFIFKPLENRAKTNITRFKGYELK